MKKKRMVISIVIALILLTTIGIIIYRVVSDESKLSSEEKTWISTNINNVQNIYVIKDEPIFSKDGQGIFYTFLNDFSENYGIKLNIVNTENTSNDSVNLNVSKELNDNIFYQDHYVLVSKNKEIFNNYEDLNDITVSILNSDMDYIKSYLKDMNSIFTECFKRYN